MRERDNRHIGISVVGTISLDTWRTSCYSVRTTPQRKDGEMREQEPMNQTMKISQARDQFNQVVGQVYRKETRILVEKSSIPVAAIVSADDLQQLNRIEEEERAARQRMQAAYAGKSDDKIMGEVAQVIAELRQEEPQREAAHK